MAYDGEEMIAEYDGSNALQRRYVFGPGGEPLVWYEWNTGTSSFDPRWYHTDERGSVISTSDAGSVAVALYAYDEYGIPAPASADRYRYAGQMWINELGMYHARARTYSPTQGRFLQTDPIGFAGGMNIYAYVLNDPVNLIDPSGLGGCLPGTDVCGTRPRPQGAMVFSLATPSLRGSGEPEPESFLRRNREPPECDALDPTSCVVVDATKPPQQNSRPSPVLIHLASIGAPPERNHARGPQPRPPHTPNPEICRNAEWLKQVGNDLMAAGGLGAGLSLLQRLRALRGPALVVGAFGAYLYGVGRYAEIVGRHHGDC